MNHFYAMLSRMKYINRWGLKRNSKYENLSEHSYDVAVIAHCLALIRNTRFGGEVHVEKVLAAALYHDIGEILHGDLPTPVKYYNDELTQAYRQIERISLKRMLEMLPPDLREAYAPHILCEDEEIHRLVKAADKISGMIKCIEEKKMSNRDFTSAYQAQLAFLRGSDLPEVQVFLAEFLPSYELELEQMQVVE